MEEDEAEVAIVTSQRKRLAPNAVIAAVTGFLLKHDSIRSKAINAHPCRIKPAYSVRSSRG